MFQKEQAGVVTRRKRQKTIGKNEQLYCVNQKKQHLNHISTTFTTIFKQYFMSCKNI